jgi:hypothetical protein
MKWRAFLPSLITCNGLGAYAIALGTKRRGAILQFGTHSPRIVAGSFAEFVEAYINDAEQLYIPQSSISEREYMQSHRFAICLLVLLGTAAAQNDDSFYKQRKNAESNYKRARSQWQRHLANLW